MRQPADGDSHDDAGATTTQVYQDVQQKRVYAGVRRNLDPQEVFQHPTDRLSKRNRPSQMVLEREGIIYIIELSDSDDEGDAIEIECIPLIELKDSDEDTASLYDVLEPIDLADDDYVTMVFTEEDEVDLLEAMISLITIEEVFDEFIGQDPGSSYDVLVPVIDLASDDSEDDDDYMTVRSTEDEVLLSEAIIPPLTIEEVFVDLDELMGQDPGSPYDVLIRIDDSNDYMTMGFIEDEVLQSEELILPITLSKRFLMNVIVGSDDKI